MKTMSILPFAVVLSTLVGGCAARPDEGASTAGENAIVSGDSDYAVAQQAVSSVAAKVRMGHIHAANALAPSPHGSHAVALAVRDVDLSGLRIAQTPEEVERFELKEKNASALTLFKVPATAGAATLTLCAYYTRPTVDNVYRNVSGRVEDACAQVRVEAKDLTLAYFPTPPHGVTGSTFVHLRAKISASLDPFITNLHEERGDHRQASIDLTRPVDASSHTPGWKGGMLYQLDVRLQTSKDSSGTIPGYYSPVEDVDLHPLDAFTDANGLAASVAGTARSASSGCATTFAAPLSEDEKQGKSFMELADHQRCETALEPHDAPAGR